MILVKKLYPDAIIPRYQTPGAACFDIRSLEDGHVHPWGTCNFSTGLAFEILPGHVMLVYSRSGHGFNLDVRLANCVGVIDSDYRGELRVKLTNDSSNKMLEVRKGDRIAQAMVIPVHQWQLVEVEELSDTQRGTGAFGSTGK